jgi:thiol:disulfide interchange protein
LAYFSLKRLTMWATIALSCALVGLLAFAIAAVIAIVQWTGEPWSALIVPGVLFLIAAITGWRALHNARTLKGAVKTYQQDHRLSDPSEIPS